MVLEVSGQLGYLPRRWCGRWPAFARGRSSFRSPIRPSAARLRPRTCSVVEWRGGDGHRRRLSPGVGGWRAGCHDQTTNRMSFRSRPRGYLLAGSAGYRLDVHGGFEDASRTLSHGEGQAGTFAAFRSRRFARFRSDRNGSRAAGAKGKPALLPAGDDLEAAVRGNVWEPRYLPIDRDRFLQWVAAIEWIRLATQIPSSNKALKTGRLAATKRHGQNHSQVRQLRGDQGRRGS